MRKVLALVAVGIAVAVSALIIISSTEDKPPAAAAGNLDLKTTIPPTLHVRPTLQLPDDASLPLPVEAAGDHLEDVKRSNASNQSPHLADFENDRQVLEAFIRESALYVDTFQPGVSLEEQAPDFMSKTLLLAGRKEIYDGFERQRFEGVADEASEALSIRLRNFFASQPEIEHVKVLLSCRSTQCEVQYIEKEPAVASGGQSHTQIMHQRLVQQDWYQEAFRAGMSLIGPRRGSVRFQLSALSRSGPKM